MDSSPGPSTRTRPQTSRVELPEAHLNDPNYNYAIWGEDDVQQVGDVELDGQTRAGASDSTVDKRSFVSRETYKFDAEYYNDLEDDSPYPEVRAAVSNTDDPSMPTNTFRMWFLGIFFSIITSGLNQFFSMRYPSVTITALVAQLLALPFGKALEKILPTHQFSTFGYKWSLNPGPFNIKEHVIITVMANVVYGGAYATDIIASQRTFYNQNNGAAYQLLLVLSTQLIGFSLAGACRRFLVWPSSMIWPATLVNSALFNTMHSAYHYPEDGQGWMSRPRFFIYAFLGSFMWYWFPGYLFTALSMFTWVCWMAPSNVIVNHLFGYDTGLGMGIITFDWAMIAYNGSPLVTPWWAQANVFASLVLIYWIICPILYYNNVFYAKYLPMSSGGSYDNTGRAYQAARIVKDGIFQPDLYREYSPLYISMTFALSYGLSFGALTSTIVHTFLWYRHDIMRQFRSSLKDENDVHSRLMLAYPEVPKRWYLLLGIISLALGLVTIEVWNTELPVWAFVVALGISVIYVVPIGMIQAITNMQVGLNVITELIVGYAVPGKPIAMMVFKTFGYITMTQALSFVSDLKLGHYMKIPPRIMFLAQTISTIVAAFVVVGVQDWMFGNIEDLCSSTQKDAWTCPRVRVFATASLIWGGIGPARVFNAGALYYPLVFFFLIGAIAPIPFYFLAKKYPQSWWKYISMPVFFSGTAYMPPATGINYSSWAVVGFMFQYLVRRRHFTWWSRYNYILSAALDSGVAVCTIVIFFCLLFPTKAGFHIIWWGNTVSKNTADAVGAPFVTLTPGETFGPKVWY